jgi:5-amino-6-(D-ribitylamino)uracil---L-tyrosine 4-hydroxyphenyl transferase
MLHAVESEPFMMTIGLKPGLETLLRKALDGADLTPEEGLHLLNARSPEARQQIQITADRLRQQQSGEVVTYVVNRNINYTNICEQHCSFCAFRRDEGDEGAYWLGFEKILEKATDAVSEQATEICMQGGLNLGAKINGRSLDYYLELVNTIHGKFPQLHIHAFSPQEIQFIAREDGLSYRDVIRSLMDAGVGSLPGTAAEVLDDRVRQVICPEKINAQTWTEIVQTAHELNLPTTSTMMSGHIETPLHQIQHFEQLRNIQKRSAAAGAIGITEFILLPFVGQDAPKPLRSRVGRDQPDLDDALLLMAVARIYLGNWIPNHQPSWVKLGLAGATQALQWGCNDIGGTLMEEHITSMAGAMGGTCQSVENLRHAIETIGRIPKERTTLYQRVKED